jgi:ABC-type dipeptide/oligopeptide/nickel transport system permease component
VPNYFLALILMMILGVELRLVPIAASPSTCCWRLSAPLGHGG